MSFRRLLTVAALVALVAVFVGQIRQFLADPTIWPPDDFIEYWAAAKLTLDGKNAYDPGLLQPLQDANGRHTDEAIMMWNPPWALAVVLPLGLFPAREAQLLWLAVNLFAVGFCGDRLWRLFGGNPERRWVGWAVALTALPSIFALQSGQIGLILLFGAVLFLECERRGYYFAAGAATVLLAVKPHLAYLVWLAIGCDALVRGGVRWRVILGGAAVGLICSALPVLLNASVWHQYLDAIGNRPPEQWVSPTLGTLLRLVFGESLFRLQFVPVLFGLAWFAAYYRARRKYWNWTELLPLLLLVSFVTAPYGAWPFDMVLLLPAVIWLVIRAEPPVRVPVLTGLLVVNAACLAMNLLGVSSVWFMWVSPVVLLLYVVGTRRGTAQVEVPATPRAVPA